MMAGTIGTPGEWEAIPPKKKGKHWKIVANGKLGGGGVISSVETQWLVAQVHNGAPGDTLETEGENARLMAAAKDLLAASEATLEWFGHLNGVDSSACLDRVRAAVAKAKGQS